MGATARCLHPTQTPEYWVEQASLYFDTLDTTTPEDAIPDYHLQVARWEWPPWLWLTGYGREDMINSGLALRMLDPSTVPERDCRFFPKQPFARCYVVFEYEKGPCPIYEEFTFNDAGEMTFIEAWSDLPELHPGDKATDPWGDALDFPRLANRVPGLGNPDGTLDLMSEWMLNAAAEDELLADFARRAENWHRLGDGAWAGGSEVLQYRVRLARRMSPAPKARATSDLERSEVSRALLTEPNLLRIDRFCGRHVFPIVKVEPWVCEPGVVGQPLLLNLEFKTGQSIEDTAPEGEQLSSRRPRLEVWVPVPDLEPATLDDLKVHIPWDYLEARDALNRFYVFEHESWHSIDVHLQVLDGRIHITCQGKGQDPNHYDGTKPEARIQLSAWFDLPG